VRRKPRSSLCACSWRDVYTIPASLSLGQRITSDSAAGKWLSTLITRKGSALRAAGFVRCKCVPPTAGKDRTLRGMMYEEAERYLFLACDELPLEFDFGGGAADGAAEAGPAALNAPDPEEPPPADLDDDLGALLAPLLAAASDEGEPGESVPPADIAMEDAAAAAPTTSAVLARNQT